MRTLIVLLMLSLASSSAAATEDEVYKWVDENGVIHYTDKPPTDNAKPAKLPPLQTYKGGTPPDLRRFDKPTQAGKPTGLAQIELVTPAHEETFRGGERTVPVAVVVTPPMKEGQRLVYLLDGAPASEPTADTSFAFTGVERGSHTAAVKLVDASGNDVATSTSVTFHMKPPIAGQAQQIQQQQQGKPKPQPKPPKPKP